MDATKKQRLEALIKEMQMHIGSGVGERHQNPVMAQIHAIIAEEQSESAQRLEAQTDTLIKLTRWLFRLTWAVVILTAGLLVLTFALLKHG